MIYLLFKKLTNTYIRFTNGIKELPDNTYKKVTLIYLSEILFRITMKLSYVIEDVQYLKLNKRLIREYYSLYGFDDTMRKFHLTEKILKRIIK